MRNQTLLLIHGGPGLDSSYFFPFIEEVKTFGYELKTHSIGKEVSNYTIDTISDELRDNLKNLNSPVTILGHSFGAALAIETLAKYPNLQKNKKLILSNWVYNSDWIEIFNKNHPELHNAIIPEDFKESTLFYLPYYFINTVLGREVLETVNYNGPLQSSLTNYLEKMDITEKLSSLKIPIFSIGSDQDKITPSSYLRKIENLLDLVSYTIPEAGHFPFIDNQNAFIETLKRIKEMTDVTKVC